MRPDERTCALQINLHPLDAPHADQTLRHQFRVLGPQVDEIVLTLDLRQSAASRYRTTDLEGKRARLERTLDELCRSQPKARVVVVDDAKDKRAQVSEAFLDDQPVPLTAVDGSPFYAYLQGLLEVKSRYVLHLDSDMLLGGGSSTWIKEAAAALDGDQSLFACNPLAGPPRSDGVIRSRNGVRVAGADLAYRFQSVSTRILFLELSRFRSGELRIPLARPSSKQRLDSLLNYTPAVPPLEDCLSAMMQEVGLERLDMLGRSPGLWSLHPPHRSERFYRTLPSLVSRVESGDVPDRQRGDFDVNDSMLDWSDVRTAQSLLPRVRRRLTWAAAGLEARVRDLRRAPGA